MSELVRDSQRTHFSSTFTKGNSRRGSSAVRLAVESLETRLLLSAAPVIRTWVNPYNGRTVTSTCYMCQYLDPMMPDSAATNVAVKSGNWSDPTTWSNGAVPAANADVLIPAGITETVDSVIATRLKWIHVYGALQFATNVNTALNVETLWTDDGAILTIGTAANPIAPNVTAKVTFIDTGATDRSWDPQWLSRGLLAMGFTTMYGSTVTPYVALSQPATAGSTDLVIPTPTGWHVGDSLVLGGTTATANQDEQLTVLGISSLGNGLSDVKVSALKYNHLAPDSNLKVYLTDTTRNVVFNSENTAVDRRGHVMFMDMPTVNINYIAFDDLGRTDKSKPINDPVLDANGQLVPGTGTNPRARYSVHFHLVGTNAANGESTVTGCSVVGSPGWGYDNHGSYVDFEDNTAYNVYGTAFVAERGDEIGTYNGNLAIRGTGDGTGLGNMNGRRGNLDFGHEGEGFWFQGTNTTVTNNIAIGMPEGGFVYYPINGMQFDHQNEIDIAAANFDSAAAAAFPGATSVAAWEVGVRDFENNITYASGNGFEAVYDHTKNVNVFKNSTAWNVNNGFFAPYSYNAIGGPHTNIILQNMTLLGNLNAPSGQGISGNTNTGDIELDNVTAEGFNTGWGVDSHGLNAVNGGTFENIIDFSFTRPAQNGQTGGFDGNNFIPFDGTTQFITLSATALNGKTHYQYYLNGNGWVSEYDIQRDFFATMINFTGGPNAGQQLYFPEQAANYVPFVTGTALATIPATMLDKTNAQLMAQYGIAVGNQAAPANAAAMPLSNGLIGAVSLFRSPSRVSKERVVGSSYLLQYTDQNGARVNESTSSTLVNGWNLLTRTVNGLLVSFPVFADVNPVTPPFTPSSPLMLMLPFASETNGYTLTGSFFDSADGPTSFSQTFTGAQLQAATVYQRTDGSSYIILPGVTYKDAAGTTFSNIPIQLTLTTPYAPLGAFSSTLDIGSPGQAGSGKFDGSTYTVVGGGSDIWGGSDQFHFVSTAVTGDETITARETSVSSGQAWAKSGLMFRNDTSANAAFANVLQTPGGNVSFEWRSTAGGSTSQSFISGVTGLVWLKLVRSGNAFSAYYTTVSNPASTDWAQVGTTQMITMATTAQVGLSVTDHDNTGLCTATFTGVQLSRVQTNLASAFTNTGIAADGSTISNGDSLDFSGSSFSGSLLNNSVNWNGNVFNIGSPGTSDLVVGLGQTLTLPTGNYSSLQLLGTAARGNQGNQVFNLNYTDGTTQTITQSMSDWASSSTNSGESVALSMSYFDNSVGAKVTGTRRLYGYNFTLNPLKTLQSITLPINSNVKVFAIDAVA